MIAERCRLWTSCQRSCGKKKSFSVMMKHFPKFTLQIDIRNRACWQMTFFSLNIAATPYFVYCVRIFFFQIKDNHCCLIFDHTLEITTNSTPNSKPLKRYVRYVFYYLFFCNMFVYIYLFLIYLSYLFIYAISTTLNYSFFFKQNFSILYY